MVALDQASNQPAGIKSACLSAGTPVSQRAFACAMLTERYAGIGPGPVCTSEAVWRIHTGAYSTSFSTLWLFKLVYHCMIEVPHDHASRFTLSMPRRFFTNSTTASTSRMASCMRANGGFSLAGLSICGGRVDCP